jgi:hypothetical protein
MVFTYLYLKTAEQSFLSPSLSIIFPKINHRVGYKGNLNIFKKTESILTTVDLRKKINQRQPEESPNVLQLSDTCLYNPWERRNHSILKFFNELKTKIGGKIAKHTSEEKS